MSLLQAIDLDVGYASRRQRTTVLAGVTVAAEAGELIAVLGPNGAGKSTLLRTLAGLQPALGGRVELLGRSLAELRPRELARRIGVVLPERVRVGLMRAFDLVALGRHPHTGWLGRLKPSDREKVEEALADAGVAELSARDVATLSDGERQKVMIARALAQESTVMILDEPTAFLDLPARVEIMALLLRLARGREERAVLLSTHDLDLALASADRVWLLDGRGGLACGVPEDLVLNGAFGAAFERGPVRYDAASGSFRTTPHPAAAVVFSGAGVAGRWTERALERWGFEVREAGDEGGDEPRVEVALEDGETLWRSTVGGERRSHGSIEELLGRLRRPGEGDTFARR